MGTNSTSYSPPALTATTYYRVQVNSNGATVNSSYVTITVYPQISPGTVSSSQTINYNTTPAALSISTTTGGNGSYSYQWQSSPNNTFSSPTNVGTNSTSYSPPSLTSTTYYRVQVTSNGATVNSGFVTITVYPQLVAGTLNSSQTINYNKAPSQFTITGTSGGNGSYLYQWLSSTDNLNWNNQGNLGNRS